MKNTLLIFGTKNFNNSLKEIKEYLNLTLVFFENDALLELSIPEIHAVLIDNEFCNDVNILNSISKINNKPVLLIENKDFSSINNIKYNEKITLPFNLTDFSNKITNIIMSFKFNKNSSIQIKDYTIDKNERKLKKKNLFIVITEREIELIELLFNKKKPLSKKYILKEVWKYAEGVDTHTIETHIYRLRKKIISKFNDENFIINSKTGYSI
tara:strand:- start:466 stop:1101 length:636 start_codon:yes stop_codon:yes gene_type:complete